ncbi:zinc ABC transporter substrate-binding protein [Candidatus Bathyarchaeota archaeon]|nr:MAG: zinc ABC transporter substrate-binding protein [Candidatus Bathyarchaeota archaeon ex4484_40]RJS77583.1 MAG: zinc ABC transporter substrate-binding protein [Candidatus Bathyarchaeota archaeon]
MEDSRLLVVSLVSIFIVVFLAGLLASPSILWSESGGLRVVVTIPPQAEFVEKVGGEHLQVTVLVPPGANPHTYEPTARQMIEVAKAKIYFQVGSGIDLELTFTEKLIKINSGIIVINCSEGIQIVDRDPHVWLSPKNAKIIVKNIYKALVQVDPENEEYYRRNMESYLKELESLDEEIRRILENLTDRCFIVYHPAWGYFARDYNLTQIPVEKEGKEPTARGLMALIDQARELNKKVIFVSPQFDRRKAETIAENIDGKVVFLDPLAKDYVNNLRLVALKIAGSMS